MYCLWNQVGDIYAQESYCLPQSDGAKDSEAVLVDILAVINRVFDGELSGESGEVTVSDS